MVMDSTEDLKQQTGLDQQMQPQGQSQLQSQLRGQSQPQIQSQGQEQIKNEAQVNLAEKIYNNLQEEKIDVMLDDRDEKPGFKFKDADLIGFPFKVVVGKRADEGIVELKIRRTGETLEVSQNEVIAKIKELMKIY